MAMAIAAHIDPHLTIDDHTEFRYSRPSTNEPYVTVTEPSSIANQSECRARHRAICAWLEANGLHGYWTESGPTSRAESSQIPAVRAAWELDSGSFGALLRAISPVRARNLAALLYALSMGEPHLQAYELTAGE